MRKNLILVLSLTTLTLFACIMPAHAQGQGKDDQVLIALVRQMIEAQAKFDGATLEKLYSSDYLEISPIGDVDERAKAIGFYAPLANGSGPALSPTVTTDEFRVRSYGNFAIVIARITYTQAGGQTAGRPPMSIRAAFVCRKEKDKWRIASVQFTGIRPPRPPAVK
jgi:uncharacterized protein (TIGR02246 family)